MFQTLRLSGARPLIASACALLLISVALSACGGGGSSSSQSSATTSGGASSPSPSGESPSSGEVVPASAKPGEVATGSPVKVGLLVDEGGTAVSQPEAREAAEAVTEYANEQLNGLAGHKIELEPCGTKEEAAAAANCANQFVQEGVVGVVVPSTGQGASAAPIITKAGIAYVIPSAASPAEYTLPGVFNLTGGVPGQIGLTAAYAKQHGIKNVTIFLIEAGNFVATAEATGRPAYEAAGVEVNFVPVPEGTPDATPQIAAGLKSDPEAVYTLGDTNSCISVMKALSAVGSKATRFVTNVCLSPSGIEAIGAENFEGAIDFGSSDTVSNDPEAVTYRWVMSEFAPETQAGGVTEFGYQAMLSFIRATSSIKGEPTAKSVLAAMQASKAVNLAIGHGQTFSCDGKVVPTVPNICGEGLLAETLNGSAEVTEVELIK
jgi:branched-chain amino acid transport system substrate-binding protein